MVKLPETKELYDFGAFRMDVRKRRLWRGDSEIALTPKEFELLLILVENAGRVVEKDDLHEKIWKDTFVEDGTLTRNISWLRKKLGDGAGTGGERFIETMPKRGYRFLHAVVKTYPNEFVVEEETQIRVRIEETISTSEPPMAAGGNSLQETPPIYQLQPPATAGSSDTRFRLMLASGALAVAAIGFVIYQNYFRQPESGTMATRIRPFSGATGRENSPAFSPDGKQIAFAWDGGENGNSNIYVRLLSAVEPLQLTDTEFNEHYPAFSPDGSQIVFVRSFADHGEVILVPALGGAERRIARLFSGNYSISFAPDGQTLAVIDTEDSTDGKQYVVYIIHLQTGERRRLTAQAEFVGETTPRFSPDGKFLAFVRVFSDKNQDLFVVPTTGGEPRQVTFDATIIHSLGWSTRGEEIFFVSYRNSNQPNIWRVSAAGGERPQQVAAGGRDISNLAVSPDGKTIAFVENTRNTDIWRVAANEQTAKKFAASIYSEHNASFSPDGSRVVFTSNRSGKYEIWVAGADGKSLRQLTVSPYVVGSPRFSPDGSHVAYNALSDGKSDIFVVSVEGGQARRLTENMTRDQLPAWSADGASIYYTSDRTGEFQIWKMSASGGEAVQITRQGAFQANAAPDGKTVFFTKARDTAELRRVLADGGGEQSMPEFAAAGFAGSWAMTPTGIYFLARFSGQSLKIKFFDFAGGNIKDVADSTQIPDNFFGNLDVTENGGHFIYSLLNQNASIIMLAELGN